MKITMRSMMSGKDNTLDIDCTPEQIELWRSGVLIQVAMPNVPAEQREFLISGVTPHEWQHFFGDIMEDEEQIVEDESKESPPEDQEFKGWTLIEADDKKLAS